MKRIALFLLTNLAMLVLLSFVARILGLDLAPARQGIDVSEYCESPQSHHWIPMTSPVRICLVAQPI